MRESEKGGGEGGERERDWGRADYQAKHLLVEEDPTD